MIILYGEQILLLRSLSCQSSTVFQTMYGAIIDSNLVEVWDCLMTVAMTGVAIHAEGMLSDSQVRNEVKRALSKQWQIDTELFDDYYEYET